MLGLNNISSFLRTIFLFVLIASFCNTIASSIGLGFPYNTFLFIPDDVFADFFKVMDALQIVKTWDGINAYGETGINHMPPFAISIYVGSAYLINLLHVSRWAAYLLVFVGPLLILLLKSSSFANRTKYWFLILFTYPVLIVLTRGNVAIWVFISLAFFILQVENIKWSMLFLALATSIKLTPVIFILYFIIYYRNNWKRIIEGCAFFLLFTLLINYLSVVLVSATVSPEIYNPFNLFQSIRKYEAIYVDHFAGLRYGSSFYMPFRYVVNLLEKFTNLSFFKLLLNIKPLIINAFVIFLLLGIYLFKFSIKKLLIDISDRETILKLVCIVFVLFTPVTGDYYLTVLLLPLFFIHFNHFKLSEKVLYILVLSPKNYLFYHFISIQVFLNPLLLLAMLLVITGIYDFNFTRRKSRQLTRDLSY